MLHRTGLLTEVQVRGSKATERLSNKNIQQSHTHTKPASSLNERWYLQVLHHLGFKYPLCHTLLKICLHSKCYALSFHLMTEMEMKTTVHHSPIMKEIILSLRIQFLIGVWTFSWNHTCHTVTHNKLIKVVKYSLAGDYNKSRII